LGAYIQEGLFFLVCGGGEFIIGVLQYSYCVKGTTWTQEIVWQIIHNGKIDYRRLDIRMPWIDGMILSHMPDALYPARTPEMMHKMFKSFPAPRAFKTHLTYELVPKAHDQTTKPCYIYVMRNPKDTAVSMYHHRLTMPFEPKPSWEEFFELFSKGEGMLCKTSAGPIQHFS